MYHIRVRIHRWVIWWFYLGLVCGVVALVNILFRDLARTQEKVILIVGILHWVLGGIVCWTFEGIQIDASQRLPDRNQAERRDAVAKEWHPASDFILPGGRRSVLPSKY